MNKALHSNLVYTFKCNTYDYSKTIGNLKVRACEDLGVAPNKKRQIPWRVLFLMTFNIPSITLILTTLKP